jgi:hypothetical protein
MNWSSTTSSFSTLWRWRNSRACSRVVPTGTVNSGDRPLEIRLEAQVAVRQDPDEFPFLAAVGGDRHAGDPVLLHQLERFEDPVGGGERDGIHDHPAL